MWCSSSELCLPISPVSGPRSSSLSIWLCQSIKPLSNLQQTSLKWLYIHIHKLYEGWLVCIWFLAEMEVLLFTYTPRSAIEFIMPLTQWNISIGLKRLEYDFHHWLPLVLKFRICKLHLHFHYFTPHRNIVNKKNSTPIHRWFPKLVSPRNRQSESLKSCSYFATLSITG
jgi:hypothetical protein